MPTLGAVTEIERSEAFFEAAEGRSLFRRAWTPATYPPLDRSSRTSIQRLRAGGRHKPQSAPAACVVLVHGLGEHNGRYEALGSWLAARGYAVHAVDCLGHGHSPGRRAHVARFDAFTDDLERFRQLVAQEHPGLPQVLLGHSMGGLIVLRALLRYRPAVAAAVTSGAALDLTPAIPPLLQLGARVMRRALPRMAVGNQIDPESLSRDPDVVRRYLQDPFVYQKITYSLAAELSEASRDTLGRGDEIDVPLLMLHGGDDRICAPAGSERFMAGVVSASSKLEVYPGLRHEIFNEPEGEQVFRDMLEWLNDILDADAPSAQPAVSQA